VQKKARKSGRHPKIMRSQWGFIVIGGHYTRKKRSLVKKGKKLGYEVLTSGEQGRNDAVPARGEGREVSPIRRLGKFHRQELREGALAQFECRAR